MGTARRLLQFTNTVVFDKLLNNGVEYSIYAGDCPLAIALSRQLNGTDEMERVYNYEDFGSHVEAGCLAPFTWIEPQYLKHGDSFPNDMHPPHNVLHAQKLVADVYNKLRSNEETWAKTLFIVNCDEGVGVFDHVPPPAAPHPCKGENHWFIDQVRPNKMGMNPFERYGTRTPCLLASPLLNPGSVVRPDDDEDYPFDHCSVIRTLFDLFISPDVNLTERDKYAPSFAPYLLSKARADLGPKELPSRAPPADDPTKLRPGGARGGCHSVGKLMEVADMRFEEQGHVDHSALDEAVRFFEHVSHGARTGFTHHLAYRRGLKTDEDDDTDEDDVGQPMLGKKK